MASAASSARPIAFTTIRAGFSADAPERSRVPPAKTSQAVSVKSIARRPPPASASDGTETVCDAAPSTTLNVAPFVTESEDAASATGARSVPPSTAIAPVNVCAAGNVSVPAPRFVKP